MNDPELVRLELFDVAAKYFELSLISGGILITVVTGFLVMAYAIGAQLSRFQTWLASTVFVAFNLSTLYGAVVFSAMANNFMPATYLDPDRGPFRVIRFDEPFAPANNTAMVGILIMLGALYFLIDVRRKAAKLEREADEAQPQSETAEVVKEPVSIAPADPVPQDGKESQDAATLDEPSPTESEEKQG